MQTNWVDEVQPFIQQRIEQYSATEIRFNLLALIRDRREVYREEIDRLEAEKSRTAMDATHIDVNLNEYVSHLMCGAAHFTLQPIIALKCS